MSTSPADPSTPSEPPPRGRWRFLLRFLLWVAAAGLLMIAGIHRMQPDAMAAVTAIPPWCWLMVLVAIGVPGYVNSPRWVRVAFVIVVVWFMVSSIEQTTSLARSLRAHFEAGRPAEASIRVVTTNCSGGSILAAAQTASYRPDVLLLQESPSETSLMQLAWTLFGDEASVVWSPDCTILARGQLQEVAHPQRYFVEAVWTLPDGRKMEVFCVRLSPPVVRYDLWWPGCWREHRAGRERHHHEVTEIVKAIAAVPADRPILLGGDFNAPAGDGALFELSLLLRDSFDVAGHGWGDTVLNQLPVHRFDQLWCSDRLVPARVQAVPSVRSDHRSVVGDFGFSGTSR